MMPARYHRLSDSINRELVVYRELKRDLDTMGQAKCGTAWHRDRVEQLAVLTRSLTRRSMLN